jgi:hypothetical protein
VIKTFCMKHCIKQGCILPIFLLLLFVSCRKETNTLNNGNKPPIALAGPDTAIALPTDTALLDGSMSTDPDGMISEWKWSKVSGPASYTFVNAASSKTVVKNLVAGTYQFELMVKDDGGLLAKDTIMLTINAVPTPNRPPVAKAGQDQTITVPQNSVELNGSSSTDPDNNISTYQWTKVAGPSSFSILTASSIQTLVNNLVPGVYQFEFKVTDAGSLFSADTIQVTVIPDLSLAIQWQKTLGGTRVDVAQSIQPTPDGGYILAGNTNSDDGDVSGYHSGAYSCYLPCTGPSICGLLPDGLVVKLSSTGAIQWQKALGGTAAENLLSIQPTADGGYIASGLTYSNNGDVSGYHGGTEADAWVVKLSSSGALQWQKVFGGTGCDFANSILSTPDGGYIFVGHTDSHDGDVTANAGEKDVWIVKLSNSGTIQWQKTLGGANNDYAYSLQLTPDGGYIAAGYTNSNNGDVSGNHGDADGWIVKISSSGAIQWQKSLGGGNEDIARSVQPTADGGYIVAGSTKSNNGDVSGNHGDADAWIVKLSGNGAIQWQKALGGSNEDIARSIQPTADGGYIIAGSTTSLNGDVSGNHGNQDAWVVKVSNTGTLQWQKSLGGISNDFVNSIERTSDGSYIVAGQAISNNGDVSGNHGNTDAWLIKLK